MTKSRERRKQKQREYRLRNSRTTKTKWNKGTLKVHKNENFFGLDFEFCTVSLLVMLKYEGFVKNNFGLGHYGGW